MHVSDVGKQRHHAVSCLVRYVAQEILAWPRYNGSQLTGSHKFLGGKVGSNTYCTANIIHQPIVSSPTKFNVKGVFGNAQCL